MPKIGFILAPNSRVAGSLVLNRELFKSLNEAGLKIEAIIPDIDKFYQVPIIGSLLNYFTLYHTANKFDYIIGTSFATLPFINSHAKIIQQFHSTDTGSYIRVMKVIDDQTKKEGTIMNKWTNRFKDFFKEFIIDSSTKVQIAKTTEGICARKAQKILVVSSSVKNEVIKFFKVNENKIKVIPNGLPDFWFENKGMPFEKPSLFFVTRINNTEYTFLEKGFDRALEICDRIKIPKTLILHFGNSPQEFVVSFKKRLATFSKAKMLFDMPREGLKKLYRQGGIFLQTSRTEACQLTLLEAMASKMVPISFPVGIAPTVIKNGENGFLVNSVEEAVKVIRDISKNKNLLFEMSEKAYQTVSKDFRFDQMVNKYKKEISSVAKETN